MGKILIIAGVVLVVLGVILHVGSRIPLPGKIPGDFVIDRGNFRIYIPLGSSILISILISVILYFLRTK